MFTIFFNESEVNSLSDVNRCDFDMFKTYFHFMKDNGVLLPPSQYEANFVSSEHNDGIIDKTIAIFNDFLNQHL